MAIWSTIGKVASKVLGFLGGNFGSSLINFGSNALSSALSYASSAKGAKTQYQYQTKLNKQSYDYNLKLQKQAQQWQQQNLSSAHQIEVADMRKAGLNPILSATGGSGAATGSVGGSSVSSGQAGMPDYDLLGAFVSSAQLRNETALRRSQVDLNKTQEDLNKAGEWQSRKTASLIGEQARNEAERYDNIIAERNKILQDIENSKAITSAQVNQIQAQTLGTNIENMYKADSIKAAINQSTSAASFNNRRSSGYSYSYKAGPVQYSYSGDKQKNPFKSRKVVPLPDKHGYTYETDSRGHKIKVRNY